MARITLRDVAAVGLRLLSVALLIGAVVMTGVGMFGAAVITGLTLANALTIILLFSVAPVLGAIVVWKAANRVALGAHASGQ
jgi:hypothetical protein